MKKISIVIPVYNEETFIGPLLESISSIQYSKESFETIVVNDASTDGTSAVVGDYANVRCIDLPENVGRFCARKTGAEAAQFPNVLFIDARSLVDPGILSAIDRSTAPAINGVVLGVDRPGAFETFYRAIRRRVFPAYFRQHRLAVRLTPDNFDSLPKGAGVLYVEKELLFRAYSQLDMLEMGKDSSDDTRLLRALVNLAPLWIDPEVKITNFSRTRFWPSVKHLFERGAKFVDYYFHPAKKNFWLVIVLPLAGLVGLVTILMAAPFHWPVKLNALLGLDVLAALVLARSPREFFTIFAILPLATIVFYSGILRGIWLKLRQRIIL